MSKTRLAIVSGALGQDGYYLTRELLGRGYEVIGTTHRAIDSAPECPFELVRLDVTNRDDVASFVAERVPSVIFNLAARASSNQLFDDPEATTEVNGRSVLWWLEAIRTRSPETRFCQASSCEVFAGCETSPQNELTRYAPTSAYGAAKAFADHLVGAYRTTHGIFAGSAILYPHESPRRDRHFLVRKVISSAVEFSRGRKDPLRLGNLAARRDWGAAEDYMKGLIAMSEHDVPEDFVFSSGEAHSVEEVCRLSFGMLGLDHANFVETDPAHFRPQDRVELVGDNQKSRRKLRFDPSYSFPDLIRHLVESELRIRAEGPESDTKEIDGVRRN